MSGINIDIIDRRELQLLSVKCLRLFRVNTTNVSISQLRCDITGIIVPSIGRELGIFGINMVCS